MLGKLIMIILIGGGAYWYWSGPYQESRTPRGQEQLKINAMAMKKCVRQEESMASMGGLAGASLDAGGAEKLCAGKLQLHSEGGEWHSGN